MHPELFIPLPQVGDGKLVKVGHFEVITVIIFLWACKVYEL